MNEIFSETSGHGLVVHVAALSGFNKSCNQIYETLNKKIFSCNFSDPAIRDEPIGFIEIDNTERQFMLKSVRLLVQSSEFYFNHSIPLKKF
jgi:hypothetical protein